MSKKRKAPAKAGKGSSARKRKKNGALGQVMSFAPAKKNDIGKTLLWGGLGVGGSLVVSKIVDKLTDKFLPPVEGEGFTWHQLIKPVVLATSGGIIYGIAKKKGHTNMKNFGAGMLIGFGASSLKLINKAILKKDILPGFFGSTLESSHYKEAQEALQKLIEDNNTPLMLDESPVINGLENIPGSSLELNELNEVL